MSSKKRTESQQRVNDLYEKIISDSDAFRNLLQNAPVTKKERYVPFDVFKQSIELMTENMKQISNMVREINMRNDISINLRFGETELTISGSESNKDFYMEQAQDMLEKMTRILFGNKKVGALKRAKERETDEQLKSYG